ncbi:MAG: TfoX/Sxy family protein [Clostridia bacterium]|nr:TfoX/Sxy family protein [Clostridia bacterium]
MASTKGYLEFVLDLLSEVGGISYRPMMGEFIIYCQGKVIGGVYDDRFLLKKTDAAVRMLAGEGREALTDIPYEGAKEMLVADVDDRELTCRLARTVAASLRR